MTPPKRRPSDPAGTPRRRPKIAGANRARSMQQRGPEKTSGPEKAGGPEKTGGPEKAGGPETTVPEQSTAAAVPPADAPVELTKDEAAPEAQSAPEAESAPETVPETETETETEAAPEDADTARPSARRRWRPVVILGAVAVLLGAFAVVAALEPGAPANRAFIDAQDTVEVTEAASDAIVAMHGYDYETIDEDFDRIRSKLTVERRAEFDATAEVTKQAALQTHTKTDVTVDHIGVSMLDAQRADVVAYINVSATGDGVAMGSAAAPIFVQMVKTDGRWLVSEIRDR